MTTTSIVLGSSGLIGAHLLNELKKKDTNIVAVMRRSEKNLPKKRQRLFPPKPKLKPP